MRHRPRAPVAPGAWPGSEHEGRGTPREPRCRPKSRGIRSPRRLAASTGRLPRPVPSFSSRRLQRPGPATPC
ncbi:protein of unassigned function [Methylobacterium oryzae CBMB20]|uniref:Protein of unassigned function n=1 Tax=Methylobacterium oryzae CBMB20 TaxID=693986 RepID=A0A089NVJ5_9HYPH|nr:protein of unassigned function [Methylobacterium oryzae CBMB20]